MDSKTAYKLAVVIGLGTLVAIIAQQKFHYHFVISENGGKKQYFHLSRNEDAVELLTQAQKHDKIPGESNLATEDYKAAVKSSSYKALPNKIKPIVEELIDCRDNMDPKDYFAEMITHSRITYWSQEQMPLKIYVPDLKSHKDGFNQFDQNEIKKCFTQWCSVVPDRVSFKMVSSPEKADIVFSQKSHAVELSYSRTVLAHTIPSISGPGKWGVYPCNKASIEPLRFQPDVESYADTRSGLRHTVFLHEIGHSLGIIGHSSNANDLMFFSGSGDLSERDKATFRRIYAPGSVYALAEKTLKEKAKAKDKYALLSLANEYEQSGTASPEEAAEVFRLSKEAADLGSSRAILMMGWLYHDGNGVKRNLMKASEYFHKAIAMGNHPALLALATACERGDGEIQDSKNAERYYKEALRMDMSRAPIAYSNFLCYQYGDPQSLKTAVAFYKKDSDRDQMEAMIKLALLYEHGEGVEKNLAEAERLRKKAKAIVAVCPANDAPSYFGRGLSWLDIGEPEKAVDDFTHAIRLKPNFRIGYTSRASAYDSIGNVTAALADLNKAIELDPDCISAYLGRAYTNIALNRPADALKDAQALLARTSPPDNDRLYGLLCGAMAARMMKDEKTATNMLEEAAAGSVDKYWPGPIISYMRGQMSPEVFAEQARGYSRTTEVRFYMAMQEMLQGNKKEAIANFSWIKESGDKTFYEYPVAIALLSHLVHS